jgi:hypothetical protein
MAIFNFWGKLWQNSTWDAAVEETASLSAAAVMPRLTDLVQAMGPAERYGYIRAHATGVVRRYAERAYSENAIRGGRRRDQFGQAVMQRVIDLVGQRLLQTHAAAPVRRAA